MDDDRQLRFACRRKMRAETRLLTCAIRMIVIIIEPALADADDARMLRPRDQPGGNDMEMLVGLVRMDAKERKCEVPGKRESGRVGLGGRRIKKTKKKKRKER